MRNEPEGEVAVPIATAEMTIERPAPLQPRPAPCGDLGVGSPLGASVDVVGVSATAGGRTTLHDVSLSVAPGEVVAIVGGSGAGKSTLLETMLGLRVPASGRVLVDGNDVSRSDAATTPLGYVPQEDIVHRDLPLARTLRYAAALRLPAGTRAEAIDRVVAETLARLDMSDHVETRVGSLSGGQRKRASIALELLTRPRLFFLDEPTSGLDPATSAEVMRLMRRLAECGTTIVLTTHNPADVALVDRVVFLARDGYLAFVGTPEQARRYFAVPDLATVYDLLANDASPQEWAERFLVHHASAPAAATDPDTTDLATSDPDGPCATDDGPGCRGAVGEIEAASPMTGIGRKATVGPLRQWVVLTRRNADLLVRNRLTLAVLAGSPALVVLMMAVLFRSGSFDATRASPTAPAQTVFWVAFAGFFFGLTYGLLQIVGEMSIVRRERLAGLGIGAYVAAKVAVLTPILIAVAVGMLAVLRALDRLPAAGWDVYAALTLTIVLEAMAALALGLLASAAVTDAAQATLALPMLCFPQVLFAGAIVPVSEMAGPGRLMSNLLANRWAFESLGRSLDVDALLRTMGVAHGHEAAFSGSAVPGWSMLALFTVVLLAATVAVLHARTPAPRA
jgi:ABC transport system ATP-binding/permease protein